VEADEIGRRPIPMIRIAITAAACQCHLLDAARGAPRWPLEMPRRALARIGRRILIWPLIVRVHHTGVVTAGEAVMAVCAAVHSPARVKTAPTKSACMKTASANERPAAEMAATPTTPREHGGSSERNNHGKSCKRRGDFPEG
jgi:hypothetical protein